MLECEAWFGCVCLCKIIQDQMQRSVGSLYNRRHVPLHAERWADIAAEQLQCTQNYPFL